MNGTKLGRYNFGHYLQHVGNTASLSLNSHREDIFFPLNPVTPDISNCQ
jgi:hypothetical protein